MSKKIFIFLIIFLIVFSFLIFNFRKTEKIEAEAWPPGWGFRKSHTLTAGSTDVPADYQVKIVVHSVSGTDYNDNTKSPPEGHVYLNNHALNWPNDIRFTGCTFAGINCETTLLDHWLESSTVDTATFWVEGKQSIPANQSITIYIYYGKSGESSASNGTATFDLFEDCDLITEWDANHSEAARCGPGHICYDSYGWLCSWIVEATGGQCRMRAPEAFTQRYSQGTDMWQNMSTIVNQNYMVNIKLDYTAYECNTGCYTSRFRVYADGSTIVNTGGTVGTYTGTFTATASQTTVKVHCWKGSSQCLSTISSECRYDYIRIRKYVDPEPSHGGWGGEKTPFTPPPPIEKENVFGWAWSENIGWISFDSLKTYLRFNEGEGTITYDKTVNHNDGYLGPAPSDPSWKTTGCQRGNCLEFDGNDYVRVYDSPSLNLTGGIEIDAWIKGSAAGFSSTQRTTGANSREYNQFQVVGDKIYYAWREKDASSYYQLWIGSMNTDGTGWTETQLTNTTSTYSLSVMPQLQVVGDKIYYVWDEYDGTYYRIFIAKTKTDGTVLSTAEIRKSQQDIFGSQFQVVGDKIYFAWTEWDSYWICFSLWTGAMDTNFTGWIWGPTQRWPGGRWSFGLSPQFQVVSDKIYYVFESIYEFPCSNSQIWTAESDINGSDWSSWVRTGLPCPPYYGSYSPQLQVVGNKIYYVFEEKDASGYYQIFTAELDLTKDPSVAWSATQRTNTASIKFNPQLQVVGNKIYYVWYDSGIWTGELNRDTGDWSVTQEPGGSYKTQFQIVGSKTYYVWTYSNQIWTGEMDSNIIQKGDFYGIGVKDNKVIGFINAGVDGFKYKGEAVDYTAGATVSAPLDSDWNHVKFTYDKTSLKLYLNETLQDTYSFTQDINVNPFDLIIGDGFVGTIDEVKIDSPNPYGVSINPSTGGLSGYTWSENIGWIDFDPDLTNRPGPPSYSACLDLPWAGQDCEGLGDWQVGGWARALAYGDGWDGWIKLRDTVLWDGVWIDASVAPKEFRDWAWGSDIVGWISFNHLNCDPNNDGFSDGIGACPPAGTPIPDYKVITYFVLPEVTDPNETFNCCAYGTIPQVASGFSATLNWTYSHKEGYFQDAYEIWVDDNLTNLDNPFDPKFNRIIYPGSSPAYTLNLNDDQEGDWLTELAWNTTYYWKVRVRDETGKWSAWSVTDSFITPLHAWPYVDFTFTPQNPSVNEIVEFIDNSECYDAANNPYSCNATNPSTGTNNTYLWDFGDGNTNSDLGDTSHFYSIPGVYTVKLSITNDIGTCSSTQQITITLPLPEWKEIPPF